MAHRMLQAAATSTTAQGKKRSHQQMMETDDEDTRAMGEEGAAAGGGTDAGGRIDERFMNTFGNPRHIRIPIQARRQINVNVSTEGKNYFCIPYTMLEHYMTMYNEASNELHYNNMAKFILSDYKELFLGWKPVESMLKISHLISLRS